MEFLHIPVMLEECMTALNLKDDAIYFDGTLGGGNHSYEILNRTRNSMLFATDLDACALEAAGKKLACFNGRYKLVHDNFKNFLSVKENLGLGLIDGALLDLGVSSYQLDERSRGFSYMADDVRLDMRMDKSQTLDAEYVVNHYSEADLARIMFDYGEERNSRQIARKIVKQREQNPITTTFELRDIVVSSYPPKFQGKPSLCNKVFQAIRIEVNNELNDLPKAVEKMLQVLKKNGRICIITFHPLEDRIIKNTFKLHSTNCIWPPRLPKCVCGHKADVILITRHPIVPTDNELLSNTRSGSAKLRIAEKL